MAIKFELILAQKDTEVSKAILGKENFSQKLDSAVNEKNELAAEMK